MPDGHQHSYSWSEKSRTPVSYTDEGVKYCAEDVYEEYKCSCGDVLYTKSWTTSYKVC